MCEGSSVPDRGKVQRMRQPVGREQLTGRVWQSESGLALVRQNTSFLLSSHTRKRDRARDTRRHAALPAVGRGLLSGLGDPRRSRRAEVRRELRRERHPLTGQPRSPKTCRAKPCLTRKGGLASEQPVELTMRSRSFRHRQLPLVPRASSYSRSSSACRFARRRVFPSCCSAG